jgi:predicted permease
MEALWRDLWFGVRTLRKNPAFAAVAILSLAMGIGVNSAIFSVTNALLLHPLPYQDADRLVILWNRSPGLNVAQDWFSPGQYLDVKAENQVFDRIAVSIGTSFNLTGLAGQAGPEHVDGARVSSSFFPLLGASAGLGRVFLPEEDAPGKPPTVILSHRLWQRRFGSDPQIVGKTLTLNGNTLSIVGVMPASFSLNKEVMPAVNGIENADVLLPLPMAESARANRGNEDYNIFARLKPGVTVQQAQADMDLIAARMKQQYPQSYPAHGGLTISVVPLLAQVVGDVALALRVLFGAVGFVLLIACANVANLLLARAAVRRREIAVRAAMGAGRGRLIRQLLTESVALASLGGVVGGGLAFGIVRALRVFGAANIPRLDEIGVDGRVVAFTCLISLLTGLVFGLVPALRASRVDLNEALKEGGRSAGGAGHRRTRKLLVFAEVALSLVLLVGAGLLVRSYQYILNAHPGFDPHNVLSLRLLLPASKYSTPESILNFFRLANEKIKQVPGVNSVAETYSLPMSSVALAWEPITIEGYVPKGTQNMVISNVRIVSPEYFRTMGVALRQGRYFTEHDTRGEQETVIVDEAMAQRFWPDENPIGKRLQRGGAGWRTVVGVINDAKQFSAENEPPITVYFPYEQYLARNMYLVVKTASAPSALGVSIAKAIQSLDPDLPVFDVKAMDERLSDALARRRFSMLLLGVFAVIALILAAVGVYGVMAYSVTQRTHEIGIRLALGAQKRDILMLVIRQALSLVSLGIAAGLVVALALTRVMTSLLYGVSVTDRWTLVVTPLLLAGVALAASYLPARRAAKVDPMVALRYE